ncbi:4-diphosphocytidyl-2C-methyl-D-erythritol kinase [Prochlorothrix hollandica PCC 9006 = CALU 1027]|uniref:4-diphosphocytidyl-2-C-methyl-D-erythritol kinase n=1 Tax=Prochlorothrix hollandica PCC 9006 = CALU 1027 TaxID=317619 RepID=A0A0M2PUE9_PROHO|nr:4-diphosphocytidyl-2C-methyl-D-erythritol kinase [Prochlorothrix hollandica PCC 9006 = CALU 1027]
MSLETCLFRGETGVNPQGGGDRPDGFHELVMIMQSVALADRVTLDFRDSDPKTSADTPTLSLDLHCDHPEVPTDASNLAHRAAVLLHGQWAEYCPDRPAPQGHLQITIAKQIPVGAGLAGGSTDAAAVLVGLNHLWAMGLTPQTLEHLCSQLGSDIPFCVQGGTVLATGRGEILQPLPHALPALPLVLAKFRSLSVSTPWAYGTYRQQFAPTYIQDSPGVQARQTAVQAGDLAQAIAQGDPLRLSQTLHNDLEKVVLPAHAAVVTLRHLFQQQPGVLGTLMSGSGPTVFALCVSATAAEVTAAAVQTQLQNPDLECWVTQSVAGGIQIL